MKKSIIAIITILLIVGSIGSVFCEVQLPPGADPAKWSFYLADGSKVSGEEWMAAIEAQVAAEEAANMAAMGKTGNSTASSQPTTANQTSPTSATSTTSKEKLMVYFTDENGRVIGVSQVTKGTTVAESQFVQEVPECNGKKFERWDYDGRVIEHQFIIRAVYK